MYQSHFIKNQYRTPQNLEARISIHQYSNKNIWDWAWDHYHFKEGEKILEVGCGRGDFWKRNPQNSPSKCDITLTDNSLGMIEACKEDLPISTQFKQVNVEDIPYPDNEFDKIISHFMLYHASSPQKALSEMVRVLKKSGSIGIITNSLKNMTRLWEVAREIEPSFQYSGRLIKPFCEENADEILKPHFSQVKKHIFSDLLEIDHAPAVTSYIKSLEGSGDIQVDESFYNQYHDYVDKEIKEQESFKVEKRIVLYLCEP